MYTNAKKPIFQVAKDLKNLPLIQELQEYRTSLDLYRDLRTTSKRRQPDYGVLADQLTPEMTAFSEEFLMFFTDPGQVPGRQDEPVVLATAMSRLEHLYRAWGFRLNHDPVAPESPELPELVSFYPMKSETRRAANFEELKQVQHAAERAAEETMERVSRYTRWLRKKRQVSSATEANVYEMLIGVAKFLHQQETDYLNEKDFKDIPVIRALRKAHKAAKKRIEQEPPTIDEAKKWLEWPEFLQVVQHLEQECQPFYQHGTRRSPSAIAASIQRFLIVAFLAFLPPDRQRTYRELEVGKTLLKGHLDESGRFTESETGRWYIHLGYGDYKTADTYGVQWHQVPSILEPMLETWLAEHRAVFEPQHNFVFTQKDGKPFTTAASFGSVFKRAVRRHTGQATTPHLVRHMLITYLQLNDASDAVMASLAAAMHHSRQAQQQIYDRRKPHQRVQLAESVVSDIAMGKPLTQAFRGKPITVESLLEGFCELEEPQKQQFKRLILAHT